MRSSQPIMILGYLQVIFLFLAATASADVTLSADKASRDGVWKKESWSKGAYVIHAGETLYKITTAKMSWSSFPGATGNYVLRLKVFAKSNGEAPIWVKVDGKEVWKGETPLPYDLKRAYCCGSKNKRDCSLNKGVGEAAWIETGKTINIKKGATIEFWGKTAYHCQSSGWKSGDNQTGYGGGTYAGIFELLWVSAGGGTPDPQPELGLSTSSISFLAEEGGSAPGSETVNPTNVGSGTLPQLSATENASWLTVKVEGSGNAQSLKNAVSITGMKKGNYETQVEVKGQGLSPKTYRVRLEVTEAVPDVTVIYPNGGEKFTVGESITIRWDADEKEVNIVDLYILPEAAKTALRINDIQSIDRKDPRWSNYIWKIPAEIEGVSLVGEQCRIRVGDYPSAEFRDESDSHFVIQSPASLFVGNAVDYGSRAGFGPWVDILGREKQPVASFGWMLPSGK